MTSIGFLRASSISFAAAAVGDPGLAAPTCAILAGNRTVVVIGMAPATIGQLCMTTSTGRECRVVKADHSGIIVSNSRDQLEGPTWIAPSAASGVLLPSSCGYIVPGRAPETNAVVIALLSALAAFLTGISAALIPRWLERRHRSREAATAWVGEYVARLIEFQRTGEINAEPRPLPLLTGADAARLAEIATQAGTKLAKAGYLRAASEQARQEVASPILAALRAYPGRPRPQIMPATTL